MKNTVLNLTLVTLDIDNLQKPHYQSIKYSIDFIIIFLYNYHSSRYVLSVCVTGLAKHLRLLNHSVPVSKSPILLLRDGYYPYFLIAALLWYVII